MLGFMKVSYTPSLGEALPSPGPGGCTHFATLRVCRKVAHIPAESGQTVELLSELDALEITVPKLAPPRFRFLRSCGFRTFLRQRSRQFRSGIEIAPHR